MLISRKHKRIVLRSRHPETIEAVIPKARRFTYNGKEFLAVKHGVDECKVLANMGIKVPSPISYYYDWPGRFKPFAHQQTIAEFLTMNNRAFNLGDIGCVDSDTEYLSPTGWARIADYTGGMVAQYHPETGASEFVEPTEFVKRPCDGMIRIKTKYGVDQLLSPEHRVVIKDRCRPEKVEVVQAAELMVRQELWAAGIHTPRVPKAPRSAPGIAFSGSTIPVTFFGAGAGGIDLSDEQLRLQIAVIADGHFPNASNTCVVRLKKERKKLRLRATLSAAGVSWKERSRDTRTAQGFTVFSFKAPIRLKEFDVRFWQATPEQLYVVCDEVMHWDGSDSGKERTSGKGSRFSSFIKASADFVQYAYAATGRVARLTACSRFRRGRTETEYTVEVRLNGNVNLQIKGTGANGKIKSMSLAPSTDGFKYCFMVPSTFLVLRRNGCVFCTGNTGKTISTLWAYDYLRSMGLVHKVLIVSPLSTLERTWADEIFQHFPHLTFSVLYGSQAKRLKMLNIDADVYLINHDGIKVNGIVDALKDRADIDMVIVDEIAQVGRTAGTDRFKALVKIINRQVPRMCWGLTGTPTPNNPTDAWAQCRLLVPERVPQYFNKFKNAVMRQVSQFVWLAKPGAQSIVQEAMQPAIRFHRDDCIDLPECMFETRSVELTDPQKKAYKEMLATLVAQVDDGQVTAVNEAVKAQKLMQIAAGCVYGPNHEELYLDAAPRINVVNEVIDEAQTKVIVFVPFVSAVEMVAAELRKKGHTVACIYGDVKKSDRDQIFSDFMRAKDPKVLVAQPATMSHGLTLTSASTIIWYAPIASADIYEQANGRIVRISQKHSQLIVNIEGTEMERRYYKRLADKQKVQGLLLDAIRDARLAEAA